LRDEYNGAGKPLSRLSGAVSVGLPLALRTSLARAFRHDAGALRCGPCVEGRGNVAARLQEGRKGRAGRLARISRDRRCTLAAKRFEHGDGVPDGFHLLSLERHNVGFGPTLTHLRLAKRETERADIFGLFFCHNL
jgi:hypothetical protein